MHQINVSGFAGTRPNGRGSVDARPVPVSHHRISPRRAAAVPAHTAPALNVAETAKASLDMTAATVDATPFTPRTMRHRWPLRRHGQQAPPQTVELRSS